MKRLEHAKTFLEGTQFSYRQVRNVVETTCPCDLRFGVRTAGFVVRPVGREKTKPRGLSIVRGGRGVAGRTVALLGAIFTYAVRQGIRLDNPVHGVVKFAEGRRQRRLSNDEDPMLGMALSLADQEDVWKPATAATWLMVLTGWRRGEVLGLRWSEVDSVATNCTAGRHQDWSIDPSLVRTGLHGDPIAADDRRCGVRQPIR